jgi:hypothetical protein
MRKAGLRALPAIGRAAAGERDRTASRRRASHRCGRGCRTEREAVARGDAAFPVARSRLGKTPWVSAAARVTMLITPLTALVPQVAPPGR